MKDEIIFIILQVSLIASFLVIFFFSYVSKIENLIVEDQVKYLIDSFTSDQKFFITDPVVKDTIKKSIVDIQAPDLTTEDEEVREHNEKLKGRSYQIILGILLVGLIVFFSYFLYCLNKGNIRPCLKMLITSLILLAAIAGTEIFFLNGIARKFVSVDPNYFRHKILIQLQKFSESTTPNFSLFSLINNGV